MHAQSCRFAGLRWRRNGLHAVSSHENPSVADVKEYTKARDVVNHAYDCHQILMRVSHFKVRSGASPEVAAAPTANLTGPLKGEPER
jgi:hypothetical protein